MYELMETAMEMCLLVLEMDTKDLVRHWNQHCNDGMDGPRCIQLYGADTIKSFCWSEVFDAAEDCFGKMKWETVQQAYTGCENSLDTEDWIFQQ